MTLEPFQERIRDAAARRAALCLRGGGTKDFYGNPPRGEILDTRGYAGIVSYEPTELVVTARCGTSLSELESALAGNRQCLPFEPPHFGVGATVGGCIAAGLAGPRRSSAGAVRDFVLGAKIVDGRGQVLGFGGQVMKNVAGYDVSRLLAGSLGTLGLIAEVSLKVLPQPRDELTLRLRMTEPSAIDALNRWGGQPLPVSASAWCDGDLAIRLSGAGAAVRAAAQKIGGEIVDRAQADAYWHGVREQTDGFFRQMEENEALWRLAVPSATPPLELPGKQMMEWGGGLRWLKSDASAALVRDAARRADGHATLFRPAANLGKSVAQSADPAAAGRFAPLESVLLRVHRELKAAFDPAGIFNPGRLFPGL